jgi:NTE family protein
VALAGGGARGFAHIGFLKWLERHRIPVDYLSGTSMGALVGAAYAAGKSPEQIAAMVHGVPALHAVEEVEKVLRTEFAEDRAADFKALALKVHGAEPGKAFSILRQAWPGRSPELLASLAYGMDWDAVLSGAASYAELSFRRKEDHRQFPNAIEFGLRRKQLSLPRGLISSHGVGLALDRVSLPYNELPSFDDMPTPFRCVAVDLVSGEAVTFHDGPLSEALRATMAIPGVFSPVRRGPQLLVDGGLLNNLPARQLADMGADVIIAVQLSRVRLDPDRVPLGGIVDGAIDVVLEDNERRSVAEARQARPNIRVIFLTLEVGSYGSLDFTRAAQIALRGEQPPDPAVAELLRLAEETAPHWEQWQAQRRARIRPDPDPAGKVIVEAGKPDARREIETQVRRGGGLPLHPPQLEQTLTRVFGIGRYKSVGYRTVDAAGQSALRIDAEEKFHGPPFVRFLAEVNGSETDNIQFNALARLTALDVGRYGAEWRTDISIGSRTALASEYDRPIAGSRFFLAPRLLAERTSQNVFQGRDRVAEYLADRVLAALDLGYRFTRRDELRSGVEIGRMHARVRVGSPLLARLDGVVSRAFLRWSHDGQDSPIVPRRGLNLVLEGSWYADSPGANARFPQAHTRGTAFFPVDRRGSLFTVFSGGTTFNETAPPAQEFTLGGPFRLGALGLDERRGNHFLYASTGYIREIFRTSPPFGMRLHLGAWYEAGKVFESTPPRGYYSNGSLGIVMETPLGPLFLGGSIGEEGRRKLYFKLGRFF